MILIIGQAANYLSGPTGLVLNMAGWTHLQLSNIVFCASLQTILNFLLIPRLGILGGALANCAALVTLNLIQLSQLRRRLGFHPFSPALRKPFLAALAALLVFVLLRNIAILPGSAGAALKGALTILTYAATLVALGLDEHTRSALESIRRVVSTQLPRQSLSGR
jgi:O-antigen/teichoic acid export membrane protein